MIPEPNNLSNTDKINNLTGNNLKDNTKTHLLILINNHYQIKMIPIIFNHQSLIY